MLIQFCNLKLKASSSFDFAPLVFRKTSFILVLSGKRTSRSDPWHISVAHCGFHAHAEYPVKFKIHQLGWFSLMGIKCNMLFDELL